MVDYESCKYSALATVLSEFPATLEIRIDHKKYFCVQKEKKQNMIIDRSISKNLILRPDYDINIHA